MVDLIAEKKLLIVGEVLPAVPPHAETHEPGGTDPITVLPTHAPTHGAGGTDPITSLGTVSTKALRSEIFNVAYAASITLDCNAANDFAVSPLTGNATIGWSNAQLGCQGSIAISQDATGGRTLTFTAPSGFTLKRDSAIADLQPASGASAITIYTWAFLGNSILLMTKVIAA